MGGSRGISLMQDTNKAGRRLAHLLWTAADLAPAPTVWFDQLLLEEETESGSETRRRTKHALFHTITTSCHYYGTLMDQRLALTCLSMTGWALVLRKWIIWQEKDHYYLQGDGWQRCTVTLKSLSLFLSLTHATGAWQFGILQFIWHTSSICRLKMKSQTVPCLRTQHLQNWLQNHNS